MTSYKAHTRRHSGPVHKKPGTFESAAFFIRIGLVNPHTRTAYFLDLTRCDEFAWMTSLFNFQVENGGQQCCPLSSPVLMHALKPILLMGHFKFIEIEESLSSRRRRVKRLRPGPVLKGRLALTRD